MVGGLPIDELLAKNADDLRPADLGTWNGQGFASLYLDDVLTRSNTSVAEHRLQVLTFLRICVIERIPLGLRKAKMIRLNASGTAKTTWAATQSQAKCYVFRAISHS